MNKDMPDCSMKCMKYGKACSQEDCRKWIDYDEDLNCCLISIKKNNDDPLTLHETGKRLGLSFVRIRQIQIKAIEKLSKLV